MHLHTPQSFCRVGVGRGDITPPVGIYHRMWGAAMHDRSTGVHRPLIATVLAFRPAASREDGGHVLISLDHCILAAEDITAIRDRVASMTSFTPDRVHVALTHTHGAGLMSRDRTALPGGDLIVPYLNDMADRVAEAAREAEQNLRPAWIVYGTGRCDLAANRDFFDPSRNGFVCGFNPAPTAPADDTVLLARVTDETGQTLATVVNYACHPTTLAWDNTLISPDYIGALRETVEAATDGAPCLFLQGASGDLGPREGFVGDTAVADRNGRQLAFAALSVIEAMPPGGTRYAYRGAVVSGATLGTWAHEPLPAEDVARASEWGYTACDIPLPYRTDLPTLDQTRSERSALEAREHAARDAGDESAARDLRARVEQMTRQIMRLEALPAGEQFPLPTSAWRLGGAIWLCVAAEHYQVLQTRLRARFPGVPIIVSTITDGWQPGYLPTAETYGKGIYQESIAMAAPGTLEQLTTRLGDQIEALLNSSTGHPR